MGFARPSGRFASCRANQGNSMLRQNPAWPLLSVDVDITVLLRCRQARRKGRPWWPRGFLKCSWCQHVHVCSASKLPSKLLACICHAVHAPVYLPCRGPWVGRCNISPLTKLTLNSRVFSFVLSHPAVVNFSSLLWRPSVAGYTGCMH